MNVGSKGHRHGVQRPFEDGAVVACTLACVLDKQQLLRPPQMSM